MSGAAGVDKLPMGGIEIKKADKWDGKDAQPIIEEPEEPRGERRSLKKILVIYVFWLVSVIYWTFY